MKSFIIFFVYIAITFIILSSLGSTKAGMGYYAAFNVVYVSILAIIIGCEEEDNGR